MEMTSREPQTPLFPPPYVNLVNKKKTTAKKANQHITPTVTSQSGSLIQVHLNKFECHGKVHLFQFFNSNCGTRVLH